MSAPVTMRKQRSRWWWFAAAVLIALAWRGCRASNERIEATLHVKLAPGAAEPWAPVSPDEAEVLATGPLFDRSGAALDADRASASAQSGRPMPDLRGWRTVRVRGERPAIDRTLAQIGRAHV